jgi:tetratricopeptide (TPR) repeat protein
MDPESETLFDQAVAAFRLGQVGLAVSLAEQVLGRWPKDAPTQQLLAQARQTQLQTVGDSREWLGRGLEQYVEHEQRPRATRSRLALETARNCFHQATVLDATSGRSWLLLGLAQLDLGCLPEALAAFRRAEELHVSDPRLAWYRGLALLLHGRPVDALPLFGASRSLESQLRQLATLEAEGQPQAAIDLLEAIAAKNPREALLFRHLAQLHQQLGHFDRALSALDHATLFEGDHAALRATLTRKLDVKARRSPPGRQG